MYKWATNIFIPDNVHTHERQTLRHGKGVGVFKG